MIDWNIQSRAHACQACHKHFTDGESFHTLLFDQKHSYHRMDVCQTCWETQFGHGATDRKGFLSHWQAVYTAPAAAPPEPIQKETAETLLRKLIELNDRSHEGALFILAVMLERKRLFKVKAQLNQEGQRAFLYEHAQSGDLFTIPDPGLQLNQLEEVQRDVAHLLEHGLTSSVQPSISAPNGPEKDIPSDPIADTTAPSVPSEAVTEAAS